MRSPSLQSVEPANPHHPMFGRDPGPLNPLARPGFGKELSRRYGAWSEANPGHSREAGRAEHRRIVDEIIGDFPTHAELSRPEKYKWCVVSRGRLYVSHNESDAYMVRSTVGGTIYYEGRPYS